MDFFQKDEFWMREALKLADKASYNTAPNPSVGCIIVKDGKCIGMGATSFVGGDHAEVCALIDARKNNQDVTGSIFYITLEPCSHYGKTPPCVDQIIKASPARVVLSMVDPNPLVSGNGIKKLRLSGIEVLVGVCHKEALWLNIGFAYRMLCSKPWVRLKVASSLDGRTALHNYKSKWITCEESRKNTHHWRARSGIILTGIGTVMHDNPLLNVRYVDTARQPCRAVIDDGFIIGEDINIIDGSKVFVFTSVDNKEKKHRLADKNVEVILLPNEKIPASVDLSLVMKWLADNCFNEIHVEAGAGLNGRLLSDNHVGELVMYLAPIFLGDAFPVAKLKRILSLKDALRFSILDAVSIGSDFRIRLYESNKWNYLFETTSKVI
ncbi:diaminohydroxyphosphoribosylaminopyrimidine deaminase [Candidatus Kinetoplastibacterium blastocrithidii TCC012E]|uniref:Riboflavin biosynthesis protein RibD n=1 Tax=Candidatus Kinetoplastidibacterium blastocrithidiae TCC012E TaxID=1208922 RepID=M1LWX3_9PROT|nr:bifunctional diaminohydroxyphosphoribosylaminopyrimidine deaminase/5-amino-6-(5-phosphoribosylamino)uracil reductase RibD [Candidatus Kinetoplastibacterium blastocrithidii]AFZ83208.1 riboflavin biosynthesis protein RibD [Candidatus Kinetoplastibacterium blastocrithidii (ex Strigomonas culicis)]AGF50022.1 diaminohydroxyphosphoribosylaminopyrimidine deaminase [Candidatus Kinetoplastibacterium blastocrithidii TCC012E]